jgi:hypothetical protein
MCQQSSAAPARSTSGLGVVSSSVVV